MDKIGMIAFPNFTGLKCNMMPFIQGDPDSLPDEYAPYAGVIEAFALEPGKKGWLTIDESAVEAGRSQRGYNSHGAERNVHVEVGRFCGGLQWGGGGWRGKPSTHLREDTQVLIANSIDDTCRVWDVRETRWTEDGDLSAYLEDYPEDTGVLLKAGEVYKIGILTPHECVPQAFSAPRRFFRIVGQGVMGREPHFTVNPKVA